MGTPVEFLCFVAYYLYVYVLIKVRASAVKNSRFEKVTIYYRMYVLALQETMVDIYVS